MKFKLTEETKQHILAYTISGCIIAFVCFILRQNVALVSFFSTIGRSLTPFIWGILLALIMLPITHIVENKWLANVKWKKKTKRRVATAFSVIFLLAMITAFFSVLIPQIVSSFQTLAASIDGYMQTLWNFINQFSLDGEISEFLNRIYLYMREYILSLFSADSTFFQSIMTYSVNLVKGVGNFFIGLIIAVYLLIDSARWKNQLKKLVYSVINKDISNHIFYVGRLTQRMLNGFLFGKALDSLLIGVITAVVCAILQMPYTPLIAFIVGITNMIPFFGPFIGAVPCFFILLIINPIKSLEFLIFIVIIQQIDGNILGPYILGDSLGLPALWVMFAILLGGSSFGIVGMVLGVPLFSVVYTLVKEWTDKRMREKRIYLPKVTDD